MKKAAHECCVKKREMKQMPTNCDFAPKGGALQKIESRLTSAVESSIYPKLKRRQGRTAAI